jgi:hypothetical protein
MSRPRRVETDVSGTHRPVPGRLPRSHPRLEGPPLFPERFICELAVTIHS